MKKVITLNLTPAEVKILRRAINAEKQKIAFSANLFDRGIVPGEQFEKYSIDKKLLKGILEKLENK